ncbi:hypothetical protein [Streptomyces sp. NPDC052114]|uniref:hypothetical protein n=1 Tax=unclassified Streptomyces TaxID=2593676 RepID=UPI00343FD00C
MTDRHTADTITDDELDALYARIEQAERRADIADDATARTKELMARRTETLRKRAEDAEAAIERVRKRAEQWQGPMRPGERNSAAQQLLGLLAAPPNPAATDPAEARKSARMYAALYSSAEQTVSRVITLHEQWTKAGPPPLGTSLSRWWDARLLELRDAIQPPITWPRRTPVDQNQRRARQVAMRKGQPLPHDRTPAEGGQPTSYFIQSRPAPSQPWQRPSGVSASWRSKATALDRLADRRRAQPGWEHRLMERIVTVTEQPATEE